MATTIPLLPLSPVGFSVHLMLAEEGTGGEPFVRVAAEQPGERRYPALLKSETGAVVARLVLQLPGDEPDPLSDQAEGAPGAALEARWDAARRDLEALAAAPRHFPSLVLPASEQRPEVPALLPPTFYCPVPGELFPVPCPGCLAPLRTCRDDAILARAELPLYSVSSRRFLYCTGDHGEGAGRRFYSPESLPGEPREKGVGGVGDLRRELAAALDRRAREAHAPAIEHLPCASCTEAGSCLGAGGRGGASAPRWVLFNRHDSPFLLTHPHHGSFEGLLDRLGGRPLDGDRSPDLGLLFSPAGSGVDAVEVLALKLAAFRQLVRAVKEYYRILGLPHLDLHPAQIGVDECAPGEELPRLWSFQVKLLGTSSARLRKLDAGVEVVSPPPRLQLPYSSPAVRASYLIGRRRGELVLDRLEPVDGNSWRIFGNLVDPDGIYPRPVPGDWILLTWPEGVLAASERTTAARPAPAEPAERERPYLLSTEPVVLAAATARKLENARGMRIQRVAYRVYPRLGISDDLHSLGALLLRAVLVNDRQDLGIVESIAAEPETDLESLLRRHGPALTSANVFFQEHDRAPGRPNAIPGDLWQETLGLALRLLATERRAETGGDDPQARLHQLWLAVGSLLRRLRLILFYRQPVHLEIRSVISELLADETPGRGGVL